MRSAEMALCAAAQADDWHRAAAICRQHLLTYRSSAANDSLGLIYITEHYAHHITAIIDDFREAFPEVFWLSAAGSGVYATHNDGLVAWFDQPAIAVMLISFPTRHSFEPFSYPTKMPHFESHQQRPAFGLVYGDPRHGDIAALVRQLSQHSHAFLAGGLSRTRELLGARTDDDAAPTDALCGVLFSPNVPVVTGLTQSCAPIGPARMVTESVEDHILAKLDDAPAFEVMAKDLQNNLQNDLRVQRPPQDGATISILAALPVAGSDTGDYLARNISGIDQRKGWVAISEAVSHGDQVMFCRRTVEYATQDMKRMVSDMRQRCSKPPRGGIYISCTARGPTLFDQATTELKMITEELGFFPLVGFSAQGEISDDRLYSHAGLLILFL